jgi:hypothetical protein
MEELFTVVLSTSAVDDDLINQGRMMNGEAEQRTQITQTADDLSVVPMYVMCQHPQGHDDNILQTVSRNAYKQDLCMQEFGISINNRLANVEARTLPLPQLKYHDTIWEECVLSIGHENIMNIRMVNGGSIRRWACINFSQCVIARIAPQLCNELIEMYRTSGMVFEMNPMLTIQCAGSEHCDDVRVAVPENNQSFSDMKVMVHSRNIVQDEFQETSNTTGLADELKESPRLSGNAEDIHSATSKSKKIVVSPEVALYYKMDADGTTETPLKGLGVWKTMHDSTLTNLAISVEEISVKQDTKACYADQPMNPRMGQTCVFSLWMEEGSWIYYIQDANGQMWERTCRDLQIHHVQPD